MPDDRLRRVVPVHDVLAPPSGAEARMVRDGLPPFSEVLARRVELRRAAVRGGVTDPRRFYTFTQMFGVARGEDRPPKEGLVDRLRLSPDRDLFTSVRSFNELTEAQRNLVLDYGDAVGGSGYAGKVPERLTVWHFRPGFDPEALD